MTTSISRRGFGSLAVVSAAVLGLAACSGSSGGGKKGSVTWSTWGSPEDLKSFDKFQEAFKTKHPDIELIFQPTPSYDEYHSKLLTQLSSGTAPDVFYLGDDRIASVIPNGVLLPLDDRLGQNGAVSKEDFAADLLSVATLDDVLYGIPNDVNPDTLWYDKEALQAAGITEDPADLAAAGQWTTETFFEMTSKLKAAGLTGAVFYNYWATHDSWMTSQGGTVYDEDGAYVAHEDETSIRAMEEFATRFQNEEFLIADLLPEGSGADTMLVTHKLGFFAAGRYTIGAIRGAGVDEDLYDIVPWPTPDGSAASTGVAASYLVINKKVADPEAAFTFFTEFLSVDGQKLRLEDSGNAVPSIQGADSLVTDGGYPKHAQTMLDMRDAGYSNFPTEAAVPDLSNSIAVDHMLPLYQGKSDARTTLSQVAELVAEKAEK